MTAYEKFLRSNKETRDTISKAVMGGFWLFVILFFLYHWPK